MKDAKTTPHNYRLVWKPPVPIPLRPPGSTTKQLTNAKKGALFVWGSSCIGYPVALAKYLGRLDLIIISPESLRQSSYWTTYPEVIIDHAAVLTQAQRMGLYQLRTIMLSCL